jgi:hypothetical protein
MIKRFHKRGAYLETRQRLGIVPTLAFWNRPDIWRVGRWLVAPVASIATGSIYFAFSYSGAFRSSKGVLFALLAGALAGSVVALWMGLIERKVRKSLSQAEGSSTLKHLAE